MDDVHHQEDVVEDDILNDGSEDEREEQLDDVERALGEIRDQATTENTDNVKGRGRSKGVRKNEPMHLEYNELGQPDGKWSGEYGKHLGSCVLRIGINVRTYSTFDVGKKLQFWEEAKLMFHIVDCEKKKKEKLFHAGVAKRFRDFKSKLVRRWITKKTIPPKHNAHLQPWEVYEDFISKDEWSTFVQYCNSTEAKARSEKARKCALHNKHKQRTGQQGYNRKRPIWIKEGRLPPEAASSLSSGSTVGTSETTSRIKYRPLEWRLAHEVRAPDGKWQIDPKDKETAEVAQKTVEFLKQQEQGLLEVSWGEDVLNKAMGKSDHRGRVIGLGGINIGYKTAYGMRDRARSTTNEPSAEVVERIKESIRNEFEESFSARVAAEVQKYIASSKLNECNGPHDNQIQEIHDPQPEAPRRVLQAPTPCHLAVHDIYSDNNVIVADGLAYPVPIGVTHNVPMLKNHYRVSVDTIYNDHECVNLPVPTGEGKTKLKDAHLSFVQWPCNLVFFEEQATTPPPKKKIKSKSSLIKDKGDSSDPKSVQSEFKAEERKSKLGMRPEVTARRSLFWDVDVQQLGVECASIHSLLISAPRGKYDTIQIILEAALWNYDKDKSANISATNIAEFLRGDNLSIPLIQVYIMYLVHEYKNIIELSQVMFLCPFETSQSELERDNYGGIMYIKRCFDVQIKKGENKEQCKFILAPYLAQNHWMLYAVDLQMGLAFEFDSNSKENRTLDLPGTLNLGYQVYRFRGGVCPKKGGKSLKIIQMKCPQQRGEMESGYYVMKFMHEIVTSYNECSGSLQSVYHQRNAPYDSDELGEIREQWATFFRNKYMLDN